MGSRRFLGPALALSLAACNSGAGPSATVLTFMEREGGAEVFVTTRMLVTPQFLRIDDGEGTADFVLYDRSARVIYSSTADTRSILVVPAAAVDIEPPVALTNEVETFQPDGNPSPVGEKVRGLRLRTNGQTCWELVVADGVADDARRALAEFARALAGEHARVLALTPPDLRSACGMANDVFDPARQYADGFPVRSKDMRGNQRLLTAVQNAVSVDPALFELPSGYRRISVSQLQGGA